MKTCECGGKYYRHGEGYAGSQRYICKECRKSITVRNGKVSEGRKMIRDWRHAA